MRKMEKALIALVLTGTLFVTGVSFAQQNNSSNRSGNNRNSSNSNNGNMMMMNGNMNSNMSMNSNMMMNGNSSDGMMMNSNSSTMNSSMSTGMMGGMSGMIGNITIDEFNRQNAAGGAAVAAITPTSTALSEGDQKLMMEVMMGGMMQLEVSRTALAKVTSEQARTLAQSEVEEQTALGAKLREIAAAKNMNMSEMSMQPDRKTQSLLTKMQNTAAGMEFDRFYIKESGVNGHKKLDKTMNKVAQRAADENLKAVEAAAHPLVRLHLQVSQAELDKMSGKNNRNSGSNESNRSRTSGSEGNSNSNN